MFVEAHSPIFPSPHNLEPHILTSSFNSVEFPFALNSQRSSPATGFNLVPISLLTNMSIQGHQILLEMFNFSWFSGTVPFGYTSM